MNTRGWIVGALVAGGVVLAARGCASRAAPDEQLAEHFESLCDIARDNVQTPERGVRRLGGYLDAHLDEMFGAWGATLVAIERVKDERAHDARARAARERLAKPLRACEADWARFGDAVENDPDAAALVTRFGDRLGRTFEIIFSGQHLDLLDAPRQLERLIQSTTR